MWRVINLLRQQEIDVLQDEMLASKDIYTRGNVGKPPGHLLLRTGGSTEYGVRSTRQYVQAISFVQRRRVMTDSTQFIGWIGLPCSGFFRHVRGTRESGTSEERGTSSVLSVDKERVRRLGSRE